MFPPEVPHLERLQGDGGATYVNIPVSPTSKKQLNYMELQEPGSRTTSSQPPCQSKNVCGFGGCTSWLKFGVFGRKELHQVRPD